MRLSYSAMSCGIGILDSVGSSSAKKRNREYNEALKNGYDGYTTILASLTSKQKGCITFLRRKGFKPVGKARRNYNTGNNILLFRKDISPKEAEKLSKYQIAFF